MCYPVGMSHVLFWFLIGVQTVLFFVAVGFLSYIGYVLWSFRNTTPYVPTPRRVIRAMLEHAAVRDTDVVYDLGAGDGRLVRAVIRRYPVTVTGVEWSPVLHRVSRILTAFVPRRGQARFIRGNWHDVPLNDATLVLCFLTPAGMAELYPKFLRDLRPGSRIVSYLFSLPTTESFREREVFVGPKPKDRLYVYERV